MKKRIISLITAIVKSAMIDARLKLELSKIQADQATGRPLIMPNHLTIGEFNWMVQYLKDRRVEILNHQADIPKDIPHSPIPNSPLKKAV